MPSLSNEPYQVIWLIRRLFRALSQKSTENLEEFSISVASRALLEFLYPDKLLSVPEIAERYQVSRQHVQITINTLIDDGLVIVKKNPNHKRSSHMMLSAKGRKLFSSILKKDEQIIEELFHQITKDDIEITRQTLQLLLNGLSERQALNNTRL